MSGLLAPTALKLRNLNVEVASGTITNRTGSASVITVSPTEHGNPFALTIDFFNPNSGAHDQNATVDIRRGQSYDHCQIFRVANMLTQQNQQRWVLSAAVGSGQLDGGSGVISYCVPQLAYWPEDAHLFFRIIWGGTPTTGGLEYYVTSHF